MDNYSLDSRPLLDNPQILGEGPLLVGPLGFAAEARARRHFDRLGWRILVRAFGPDGFAFFEANAQAGAGDVHTLTLERTQVHFDAALRDVPKSLVGELLQVEVRAKLAIDAREHVKVKRSRHTRGIVVRKKLYFDAFFEIG